MKPIEATAASPSNRRHACRVDPPAPAPDGGADHTGRTCADFGSPDCCAAQGFADEGPQPDLRRMRADVASLVGFGTRNTLAANHAQVAAWLEARLAETGAQVRRLPYSVRVDDVQKEAFNLEWEHAGWRRDLGKIVLTAHFDSINTRNPGPESPAPGANDNASSVAALLETARLLAPLRTRRSVRIALLSGEEQDSLGAAAYAQRLVQEDVSIRWLANLDMIGTSGIRPVIRVGVDRVEDSGASSRYREIRQTRASLAAAQRFVRRALLGSDIARIHVGTMGPTDGDSLTRIWLPRFRKLVVFDIDSGGDPLIHRREDVVAREQPAAAGWDDCNWWRITRLVAQFVREEAEARPERID